MKETSVVAGIPGFFEILSDGSVKRFPVPAIPTSPDFANGFKSKDIVIDADKPITARIFVPDTGDHRGPLPVVLHFHGGGFCVGSTTSRGFHYFLAGLCVKSQALIVSVDYRLAPEHKIPAAYEDGYSSLLWLIGSSASAVEPWLERADLSRVFLSGESAGANIVHHVALRLARDRMLPGVRIKGLVMAHPFFGGEERTESELAETARGWMVLSDATWRVCLPEGADRDHWACNFDKGDGIVAAGDWPAAIVFVAGKDVLMERGLMYAEFLKKRKLLVGLDEVEVVVAQEQDHGFHCLDPHSQDSHLLTTQMAYFINHH
ncbi:gibberellin receptor GID1L2 [Iris pallida]|uniref:Gibberellin receptor GID1L2 n=1 Tax=Iris pallida TaxID=29817 RepID=A0AAX6FMW6_IRIPA|nr:gibberellin receptor GID1L2 [Iris pallida]